MLSSRWRWLPLLLLAGCAQLPHSPRELSMRPLLPADGQTATPEQAVVRADWWQQPANPQLNALVALALRQSPQREQVLARLDHAAAHLRSAAQARLPAGNVFADAARQQDSVAAGQLRPSLGVKHGLHKYGMALDYDIDYLQRHARAEQAAQFGWQAARENARQLDNMLVSQLLTAYLEWQHAHRQHALQQRLLQNRQRLLSLVRDKAANGLESRTAVHQAEARWQFAQAALVQAAASIELQRLVLLSLAGDIDNPLLDQAPPDAFIDIPLPAADRMTLNHLGQRPDIIAARLRVEAGSAKLAVARAGFYPDIRLSLLAGMASSELETLDRGDARFGAAGISISLPIFRSAQLQGDYLARQAEQHEAIARYHQTVLDAVLEWRSAWQRQQQAATQLGLLQDAQASASAAVQGATERYRHGLGSLLEVLQAEDLQLASESQALAAASDQAIHRVRLMRALGGKQTDAG